jgi:hypothetical protein
MAEGIEVRHARSCATRDGKRCDCEPGYRVVAYDAISKNRVSKTFRTLGGARAWRATAQTQTAKGIRLAGTPRMLKEAAEPFLVGVRFGYGHLMPGNEDEAVALVDAYLEPAASARRLAQLDQ